MYAAISQEVLQKLSPTGTVQEHAGWAHFFSCFVVILRKPPGWHEQTEGRKLNVSLTSTQPSRTSSPTSGSRWYFSLSYLP
jgi:hypothetical protein